MLIEVKQWPESQEVMENSDWLDESEYMLIKDIKKKYIFSEYVNLYSSINPEKEANDG